MRTLVVAWLLAVVTLVGCKTEPSSSPACTKDSDCKGDRVCDDGKCVSPGASSAPATANTGAARAAAKAEALAKIESIEKGSGEQFQILTDEGGLGLGPFVHVFCPSAAKNDWTSKTWKCLRFDSTAVQCDYEYASKGSGGTAYYTATATCDPDHDGRVLRVVLKGAGEPSGIAKRLSLKVEGDIP